jgi:hypothetical protein
MTGTPLVSDNRKLRLVGHVVSDNRPRAKLSEMSKPVAKAGPPTPWLGVAAAACLREPKPDRRFASACHRPRWHKPYSGLGVSLRRGRFLFAAAREGEVCRIIFPWPLALPHGLIARPLGVCDFLEIPVGPDLPKWSGATQSD